MWATAVSHALVGRSRLTDGIQVEGDLARRQHRQRLGDWHKRQSNSPTVDIRGSIGVWIQTCTVAIGSYGSGGGQWAVGGCRSIWTGQWTIGLQLQTPLGLSVRARGMYGKDEERGTYLVMQGRAVLWIGMGERRTLEMGAKGLYRASAAGNGDTEGE